MHVHCPHCQQTVDLADDSSLSQILCSSCGGSFSLVPEQTVSYRAAEARTIGHFELLDQVGIGAFGTVWRARDTALDRTVAIKIPRKGQLSAAETEQFLREARAAAQLSHPSIVSVHEVGRDEDTVYIVSDFVRGMTLADWLTGQRLAPRQAAEFCAQIADALDHAHKAGVIHRDMKPGNIMLDDQGRPHVMDFGLAKREAGEVTMTLDGQVLGTPAYMSPEQAAGESHKVDGRSDLYSLGVIFYQLLTGELPFRGNRAMLLHQVLNEDPRAPRKLNNYVPRDLETICLRAMAKEPARRYQTAADLAADLRRFLGGEPIHARPVGRIERLWRWSRRNPAVASMAAAVFVVAVTGFTGITWQWLRAEESADLARTREGEVRTALEETKNAQERAEEEELTARRHLYAAQMNLAMRAWEEGNLPLVRRLLDQHQPVASKADLRGFDWYYLWRLSHPENVRLLYTPGAPVGSVAFWPDGTTLAGVESGRTIRLWDVGTGKVKSSLRVPLGRVAYSPDGRTLASYGNDAIITLWDARGGKLIATLSGHKAPVRCVAFSHDGKLLASGTGGITDPGDQMAKVWDATTGKDRSTLKVAHAVFAVAFSPDDKLLATGGGTYFGESELRIWDIAAGREKLALKGHQGVVYDIVFTPDAATIVSGASDTTIRVWDAKTGQQKHVFTGHTHEVRDLALSADGLTVASASADLSVRLWDLAKHEHLATLGHDEGVDGVALAPDGKFLASVTFAGAARLWDLSAQSVSTVLEHGQEVRTVAYSPTGKVIACGGFDGIISLWDFAAGRKLGTLQGHSGVVGSLSFSPDGKMLASAAENPDGTVRIWDLDAGQTKREFKEDRPANRAAFSPDGRLLAIGTGNCPGPGAVNLYDVALGSKVRTMSGHGLSVEWVAFSPDGTRLVTSSLDRLTKLWDVSTGSELFTLRGHDTGVLFSTFSPDGKRVVTTSRDPTARLWDAATGQELFALAGHRSYIFGAAFSPDSMTLATAGWDGTVKLWDVITGQERATIKAHARSLWAVAFSPDGRTLATASRDGTVKLWRAATDQMIRHAEGQTLFESARAHESRSDWQKAIADYAAAIKAGVGGWEVWHSLGHARERLGEWDQAIADFSEAIRLQPAEPKLWDDRANDHAHLQQWAIAAADFAKAVELRPDDCEARYRLGLARLAMDDVAGYRAVCAEAMGRFAQTDSPGTANSVAWMCVIAPDAVANLPELASLASKAVSGDPASWACLNTLGAALCRAGRYEEAIQRLKESIRAQKAEGSPWDWLFLAMAHQKSGQTEAARKWLDKARTWMDEASKDKTRGDGESRSWPQQLELQLLRREAEIDIVGKPPDKLAAKDAAKGISKQAPPPLLEPPPGAILENRSLAGDKQCVWQFSWSRIPGAQRYHLQVRAPNAPLLAIDNEQLTDVSFRQVRAGYVANRNRLGWTWRVRALMADGWTAWSGERSFDVEPPR